jgi:hypothetical protein
MLDLAPIEQATRYQTFARHDMNVLVQLGQIAEPYRQARYIITSQAATTITPRQTLGSFSALLYGALLLIFWPVALLYLGGAVNRREQVTPQPAAINQRNAPALSSTRQTLPSPPLAAVKAVKPDSSRARFVSPHSVQGKAILAVMREHIEDEAEQKVIFQHVSIKVQGEWALFRAEMRGEKGGKVSTYPPEDGSVDHPTSRVVALLRVTQLGWSMQAIDSSATKDSAAALRRVMPNAPPGLFTTSARRK